MASQHDSRSIERSLAQEDLVSHTIRFCRALREGGLLVGPSESADAVQALGLVDIMDRAQVYWALRAVLVSRVDEVAPFDNCFHSFWTFRQPQPDAQPLYRGRPQVGGLRQFRRPTGIEVADGEPGQAEPSAVQIVRTGASPVELVGGRDLTILRGNDLEEVFQIARRITRALPSRPGRRRRRHRRKGVPDLRGALRLNLSHGGDLIALPRRRRALRVPRLLVLLDVSGSMDRHTELLLQLLYALVQGARRVETFVFSTSLSRVTRHLRAPSFSEALGQIGGQVAHWSGGTRIGGCLATLNHEYSGLLDHSTSVFILSDGWETGDPEDLAMQLARLRRRVTRLVWLNPLLGTPAYSPLTLGLQAARPYVDTFASALGLRELKRLPVLLRG